jgi:phage repressor protein C with HTH and peptisase S24 domain
MSEPPTDIDPEVARIDAELRRQGKARAALGRAIGLDSKQLNRLFKGERRLQMHEHNTALEFLGLAPPPMHSAGGSVIPLPGLVPIYGWVGAATDSRLTLADQNLRGYVPMHPGQANVRDAFALEVADVSMEPRYEPGETVYLAPNRWPRPGQDCVVVTKSGQGLLKRFVRRQGDTITLHQFNPVQTFDMALEEVEQIHTVVGRS